MSSTAVDVAPNPTSADSGKRKPELDIIEAKKKARSCIEKLDQVRECSFDSSATTTTADSVTSDKKSESKDGEDNQPPLLLRRRESFNGAVTQERSGSLQLQITRNDAPTGLARTPSAAAQHLSCPLADIEALETALEDSENDGEEDDFEKDRNCKADAAQLLMETAPLLLRRKSSVDSVSLGLGPVNLQVEIQHYESPLGITRRPSAAAFHLSCPLADLQELDSDKISDADTTTPSVETDPYMEEMRRCQDQALNTVRLAGECSP